MMQRIVIVFSLIFLTSVSKKGALCHVTELGSIWLSSTLPLKNLNEMPRATVEKSQ